MQATWCGRLSRKQKEGDFTIPNRSLHNMFNALLFGFSGNEVHAYMDRAAKGLRHKHREVGHDSKALVEMLLLFRHKYNVSQILQSYWFHKLMDGSFSGFQAAIKKNIKGYGKKDSLEEMYFKLRKELLR